MDPNMMQKHIQMMSMSSSSMAVPKAETEGGMTGQDEEHSVSLDAPDINSIYSKRSSTPGGKGYAAPGMNMDNVVISELNREETEKSTDDGMHDLPGVPHKMSY